MNSRKNSLKLSHLLPKKGLKWEKKFPVVKVGKVDRSKVHFVKPIIVFDVQLSIWRLRSCSTDGVKNVLLIVFGHQASVEMQEIALTVKFWG